MKKICLFIALISTPFLQAAELVSTNGVEILAIDGKKIKQQLFSSDNTVVDDGQHQVAVMYKGQFKNSETISSRIHIFDIDAQGKTVISIKRFGNPMQAKNAINKGVEWIVTNDQTSIKIKDSDVISGEGLFPNSNVEKLISEYNQQHNINLKTDVTAATTETATATTALTNPITTKSNKATNTAILIDTYQKASKQEQKAFRMWLLEQDMK